VIRAAALLVAAAVAAGCSRDSEKEPIRRYLVYTKAVGLPANAVWIGDIDGRNMRRLVRGDYGLVSPNGRTVAFSRGYRTEARTIGTDGSGERSLSRGWPMGWFSDSRHLLVSRRGELVSIDSQDGEATVLLRDSGLLRGWSVSPTGTRLAYGAARKESRSGRCGEYIDIYLVDHDGSSRQRLTNDGRSSDPVWGDGRIAFAREPVGPPCALPKAGVWTMKIDGSDVRPVLPQAPRRFAWNGYYGLRPHGWVGGRSEVIAGVRTEWGDELALVDTRSGRVRKPDLDPRPVYRRNVYVEYVSQEGRYVLASPCGAEYPCSIAVYSILDRRARTITTGRVGDAHWNR
jgi:hypothetical protein